MNETQTNAIKSWSEQRDQALLELSNAKVELDVINNKIKDASEGFTALCNRHEEQKSIMTEELRQIKKEKLIHLHDIHIAKRDLKKLSEPNKEN